MIIFAIIEWPNLCHQKSITVPVYLLHNLILPPILSPKPAFTKNMQYGITSGVVISHSQTTGYANTSYVQHDKYFVSILMRYTPAILCYLFVC